MGCEEIVEVVRGDERGGTGGIYSVSSREQQVIYRCIYSVWWWVDRVVSIIYRECIMYRGSSYNREICVSIMYIQVTVEDMLHISYVSVRSRGMA